MLVYKDGDVQKDILGFRCDLCDCVTLTDVVPNKHGEFRYICPKCGHKMKELPETKEEETKMVNTYTISNAAKRLNCGRATIARAIYDGRFHDCFMEAGHNGRPAWMIPSDQVEEWVTKGGFVQPGKRIKKEPAEAAKKEPRKVFDPEVGKEVPVLDLLGDIKKEPEVPFDPAFAKRAVRRVAKPQQNKKYTKVLDRSNEIITERDANGKPIAGRYPWEDTDGDSSGIAVPYDPSTFVSNALAVEAAQRDINRTLEKELQKITTPNYRIGDQRFETSPLQPVVRTDAGFTITFPTEMVEEMVQKQIKSELAGTVGQLRAALDMLDKELKKLEEAIA